jgi:hypothetical protein
VAHEDAARLIETMLKGGSWTPPKTWARGA